MNKPIYRHLADLKWRDYERKVLMQRITQMNVIPDVLPTIDPIYSTTIRFGSNPKTAHGEIVHSSTSEHPPVLTIQPYDKGERLFTIAVVNPDMPNVEKDGFDYRCHFLASNIKLSPIHTKVDLGALDLEAQVLLPWLPPHVQKGLPYQRHAIFILEQGAASSDRNPQALLDLQKIRQAEVQGTKREGFLLKDFVEQFNLLPRGVDLFRAVWDDGTRGVMERAGIVGGDVEFKRKRVEPLPYQRLKGERYR
jgi:large subunit ribosomal protein L35